MVRSCLLDQLQYHRSRFLVSQGCCHSAWIDLWHRHLVDLLDHSHNIGYVDLGLGTQSLAYVGRIQYSMDLAQPDGSSATLDLTVVLG